MLKKGFLFSFLIGLTACSLAWADDPYSTYTTGGDEPEFGEFDHRIHPHQPFEINGFYLQSGEAELRKKVHHDRHLTFALGEANAIYTQNIHRKAALVYDVGFSRTRLDWEQNPYFNEKEFNRINASIGAITNALKHWLWEMGLGASNSIKEHTYPSTVYSGLLHGRNAYTKRLGIHIGITANTGMRKTFVLPILGVDYKISRNWQLNLVFPEEMSILYNFKKYWAVGIRERLIRVIQRLSSHDPMSRGIVVYQSTGTEGALTFEYPGWFGFELFAGSLYGARLKIYNHKAHNLRLYKFDETGYAGASLFLNF